MEGTAYKALLNGRLFEEAVLNWQTAFIADASDERTGWREASASAFYPPPLLSSLAASFSVSANSFCSDFMGEINWKERRSGQKGIPPWTRLCLKKNSEGSLT